jgi:uncharacterized protein (TIGR03382 family)
MRYESVFLAVMIALPAATFAQVSHVSAERSILAAGAPWLGTTELIERSTRELGVWNADAILNNGLASASLRSTIENDRVAFHADLMADSRDLAVVAARCRLAWVFTIDRVMRWDLRYQFDVAASGSLFNTLGRIDDGDDDVFRSFRWFEGRDQPVFGTGYLDPGTYRLNLESYAPTTQLSASEIVEFSLIVPTPPTLMFGMVSFAALRRRRH